MALYRCVLCCWEKVPFQSLWEVKAQNSGLTGLTVLNSFKLELSLGCALLRSTRHV